MSSLATHILLSGSPCFSCPSVRVQHAAQSFTPFLVMISLSSYERAARLGRLAPLCHALSVLHSPLAMPRVDSMPLLLLACKLTRDHTRSLRVLIHANRILVRLGDTHTNAGYVRR
eukprot:6174862-Pleurochrysis_carterae.AAC.1